MRKRRACAARPSWSRVMLLYRIVDEKSVLSHHKTVDALHATVGKGIPDYALSVKQYNDSLRITFS